MSLADQRAARLAALPFEQTGPSSSGHVSGFFRSVGEIWGQRELLDLLVRRELKSKYKDSSLGYIWTLIRPLVMLLIYYFVIGKVLGAERSIPQYAIFVFCGLTIWGLFAETITGGTNSILANAGLIKKVYLPREIFPVAATGSALVNFGSQLIVLFVACIVLRQFPWHPQLLYAVPALAIVLIWGTALGLLLSAVNVYLRDMQYLVEVGLLIFFWMSPIVYNLTLVRGAINEAHGPSWIQGLYLSNPIATAILSFQKAIWVAGADPSAHTVYPTHLNLLIVAMIVVGLIVLTVAQRVFARLQGNFAQEI